jgi:hypothetical protein
MILFKNSRISRRAEPLLRVLKGISTIMIRHQFFRLRERQRKRNPWFIQFFLFRQILWVAFWFFEAEIDIDFLGFLKSRFCANSEMWGVRGSNEPQRWIFEHHFDDRRSWYTV